MNNPTANYLDKYRNTATLKAAQTRGNGTRVQTMVVLSGALIILLILTSSVGTSSSASSETAPTNEFDSLFVPVAGTITIKAGNYIGTTPSATTETAKFTKLDHRSFIYPGRGQFRSNHHSEFRYLLLKSFRTAGAVRRLSGSR